MTYSYAFGRARDGGFAAWIPGSNISAYAYPGSPSADRARGSMTRQSLVAVEMLNRTIQALPGYVEACGYTAMVESHGRVMRAVYGCVPGWPAVTA